MDGSQRLQEMEFELALTSQLEEVYGLRVRSAADPLDRRKAGYTTLCFGYQENPRKPGSTRVRVEIEGRARPSYRWEVDLSDVDQVESATSDCEALALAIQDHLQENGNDSSGAAFRRREED